AAEFGKLFDAVVEQTAKSFWDKERLTEIGWRKRAAEVRQSVVDAPTLEEAARRINVLLGELNTSHTALYTPDDRLLPPARRIRRRRDAAARIRRAVLGCGGDLRGHRPLLDQDRQPRLRRRGAGRIAGGPRGAQGRRRDPRRRRGAL